MSLFQGLIKFSVLLVLIFGCARPNYQDPPLIKDISPNDKPGDGGKDQDGQKPPSSHCKFKFKVANICLTYKWETSPEINKFATLEMKFFAAGFPDSPIDPKFSPAIKLWMPSMNHGSRPVQVSELSLGVYRAEKVFFLMSGEWEIKFQLKNEQGLYDEVSDRIQL